MTTTIYPASGSDSSKNRPSVKSAATSPSTPRSTEEDLVTVPYSLLLEQIATLSLPVPITLVMDNARYQRCALVQELAKQLHIELLFLPSYSPNLNLIERLWKFVKKKCLYSTYYENFDAFQTAISACLDHPHLQYKDELDSLLTLNFQSFDIAA